MTTRAGGCSRLVRHVSQLIGLLAYLCVTSVYALGLGEMRVQSALGEPLVAEIELLSTSTEELSTLEVTLGTQEVFNSSGVNRPSFLAQLQFEVVPTAPPAIRVTSLQPINEPFLHLIIRSRWEFGMLLSEYTALLDPPLYGQQQPGSISSPIVIDQTDEPVVTSIPEETVSPQPVSSQPVSSQPQAYEGAAAGFEYGPVAPGDNLWGIASQVDTAGMEANIFQVMVALLRENPAAFIDNNINRIKIGETLRLSDSQTILLISKSEASKTYKAQIEQWETGRRADAMVAGQPDDSSPATELIQEETAPVQVEPDNSAEAGVAEMAPSQQESAAEATPAESEGQLAEAQPADKNKYVFKIAPPASETGEGPSAELQDAEVEVEAMRAAIDREIAALREQVAKLELQQRESESASSTETEIASFKAEAEKEISGLREQITFLKQAAADQEILALRGQITAMKQSDTMSADASGATAALSQAQEEISELRAQVASLSKGATDEAVTTGQQDFSDLSNQVDLPQQTGSATAPPDVKADVEAIRTEANEQIGAMREQMEAMRAEMGKLMETQELRNEENTLLEKRVSELMGMLEGKVESTTLATMTTSTASSSEESKPATTQTESGDDAASGRKQTRVVSGKEEGAAPIWQKWLDKLPDDDESRIAIGAGVLLILLVLWLMVRRRRSLMRMEESILMTGGTLDGTVSQLSEIRSKKPRYLSDLSMAGMGRMEAAEVDPLAEAEVYLAYGRAGQAVQVLKDAAKRDPQRQELQLKLLEVYQQQNDVKSFDDLVSEMNLSEATADQVAWNKVVELKLKMHEHGPLGLAGNAGVAAGAKENVSTQGDERDWVLALDDESDLQDDPPEELPEATTSHELLTKSSGPVDPALRPFPEPDDDARVGEDVLGTLGRPSGLSEAEGLKADLPPGDPEMMNFNTTSASELIFELDPGEDELGESPAGSPGQDSDIDLTQLLSSESESNQGQASNEISIKAELAEAYLNMGDKEEALRILEEIIGAAGPDQKQQISDLIRRANQ